MSTQFERTFKQRTDTRIVHEPFSDVYYYSADRRSLRYGNEGDLQGHDTEFATASIFGQRDSVVFVKDLAFQGIHFLTRSALTAMTNTFLIRRPQAVVQSLSKLKPDFNEEELGFSALEQLFDFVVEDLRQIPILVEADRFCDDPERVLRAYCAKVDIAFDAEMLQWNDGRIQAWSESQRQSQAKWHLTLESSRGIHQVVDKPANLRSQDLPFVERAKRIYERLTAYAL